MNNSDRDVEDQRYTGLDFTVDPFIPEEISDCVFDRCNFQESGLKFKKFIDTEFIGCNLTLASIISATFRGCKFVDCKLTGINWSAVSVVTDCSFKGCNLSSSMMMNLDLRHFVFENSLLKDVDFSEADLRKSKFPECDLAGATFRATNLAEADFSTARNYFIDPTFNTIKKAKFSLPEAVSLLTGLGIKLV